jgi:CheY-like chemotaxis protein
LRPDTFAA